MGWPKKNEGFRLYFERKAKTYLILEPDERSYDGNYPGVAEVMTNNDPDRPCLGTTGVSDSFLYSHCRRASWAEMPPVWRAALASWMTEPPEKHRGLWRIGEMEEFKLVMETPAENLPLLIDNKWKHKHMQTLYENRLKGD